MLDEFTLTCFVKERHPERWSGAARNWSPVAEVWLNPEKPEVQNDELLDEVT